MEEVSLKKLVLENDKMMKILTRQEVDEIFDPTRWLGACGAKVDSVIKELTPLTK